MRFNPDVTVIFERFRRWWNQSRLRGLMVSLFGIDQRSLALARVGVAAIVIGQVVSLFPYIEAFYSDRGVLPRTLWPELIQNEFFWSIYFTSGVTLWIKVIFVLHILVAVCVLIGYRTRFMTVLLWIFTVSFFVRNGRAVHMGDYFLCWLILWGCFVPWGNRFSIDHGLARPFNQKIRWGRILSPGTIGLILQGPLVYFLAGFHKLGTANWTTELTAFMYAINPQLETWVGFFVREYTPEILLKGFTAVGLATELLVPVLLFLPLGLFGFQRAFDRLRIGLFFYLAIFQLMLEAVVDVGFFPYITIVGLIPIIPARFWKFWEQTSDVDVEEKVVRVAPGSHVHRVLISLFVEFLCIPAVRVEVQKLGPESGKNWSLVDGSDEFTGKRAISRLIELSPLVGWMSTAGPGVLSWLGRKTLGYVRSRIKQFNYFFRGIGIPGYRYSMGYISHALCIVLLVVSGILVMDSMLERDLLSYEQNKFREALFLSQDFDIFTTPFKEVARISVLGTMLEGKDEKFNYVMARGGAPATRRSELEQPRLDEIMYHRSEYSGVFEHHRWRVYIQTANTVRDREAYLKYVCWAWNSNHYFQPVLWKVRYVGMMESDDFLEGYYSEPKIREIYEYHCLNDEFSVIKGYGKNPNGNPNAKGK